MRWGSKQSTFPWDTNLAKGTACIPIFDPTSITFDVSESNNLKIITSASDHSP